MNCESPAPIRERCRAGPIPCSLRSGIPALYEIVAANARIAGDLDGVAYTGARYLSAGSHLFYERSRLGRFCLIWAPAAERHFLPWLRGRRH